MIQIHALSKPEAIEVEDTLPHRVTLQDKRQVTPRGGLALWVVVPRVMLDRGT